METIHRKGLILTTSIVELFISIEQYKGTWFEQDECLLHIKNYREGQRYERND